MGTQLDDIVRELVRVSEQARRLGIFTDDRDLLTCPRCGLMEDVLCDGRLVTYHETNGPDTGLRFTESTPENGRFACPECGTEVQSSSGDAGDEDKDEPTP